MKKIAFFIITLFIISCTTNSKSPLFSVDMKNLNDYQKGFLHAAKYIRKNHAGLYSNPLQVLSFEEYDSFVLSTLSRMEKVNKYELFVIEMSYFLEKLKDGHTFISSPPSLHAPFGVWWFDNDLYITSVANEDLNDFLYKKITKIGGIKPLDYEKRINEYISADKDHVLYKRLFSPDLMFSKVYLEHLGLIDDEVLEVTIQEGEVEKAYKTKCTFPNPNSKNNVPKGLRNSITIITYGNRFEEIPKYSLLYIQLNDIKGDVDIQFYNRMFNLIREKKYKNLILDLRNNRGGNSNWCNAFLKYLIGKPSSIYIYDGWISNYPYNNIKDVTGITLIQPTDGRKPFDGNLYILTSPFTFSSATFFVVAVKDNKLGKIIGEPVGNTSIRYGSVTDKIQLDGVNLSFSTTHRIWKRSLPGILEKESKYIEPDIWVNYGIDDYIMNRDPVYDKTIEEISLKL